jgi:hypothetical protein
MVHFIPGQSRNPEILVTKQPILDRIDAEFNRD